MSSFLQENQNRILAACILAAFVLLLCAIIWHQQGEIERLERESELAKETLGRIIEENNELKLELGTRSKQHDGKKDH